MLNYQRDRYWVTVEGGRATLWRLRANSDSYQQWAGGWHTHDSLDKPWSAYIPQYKFYSLEEAEAFIARYEADQELEHIVLNK